MKALFQLVLAFTLSSSIAAQVTWTNFSKSFRIYPGTGPGGCDRNAPNGVPMKNYVLTSLNDAWTASNAVTDNLPKAPSKRNIRGLLFLLFGITFNTIHLPNRNDGSATKFSYIRDLFTKIDKLQTDPTYNPHGIARFRCLEDYATYYRHMPGTDGRENMSAPLVAEVYNIRMPDGSYYPGLMYVNNQAIPPHNDLSQGFYASDEENPAAGSCGSGLGYPKSMFTLGAYSDAAATYGLTLCPYQFNVPLASSLGSPVSKGGEAQIEKFRETGGMLILHEFVHLVTNLEIKDQLAAYPPDGKTWTNRDWASWVLNPDTEIRSYGYAPCAYLGLSMPALAMKNADNFMVLALCLRYASLDCLGKFQNDIRSKRDVPFQISSRTVQKIRSGDLDLKKDDISMEISEGFAYLNEKGLKGAGSLEQWHSIGQTGQPPARFNNP